MEEGGKIVKLEFKANYPVNKDRDIYLPLNPSLAPCKREVLHYHGRTMLEYPQIELIEED